MEYGKSNKSIGEILSALTIAILFLVILLLLALVMLLLYQRFAGKGIGKVLMRALVTVAAVLWCMMLKIPDGASCVVMVRTAMGSALLAVQPPPLDLKFYHVPHLPGRQQHGREKKSLSWEMWRWLFA